jgi:hypothetical protein
MQSKENVCRNCGARRFYTRDARLDQSAVPVGIFFTAACRVRVCGACGLVDWFLTSETLDYVRDNYEAES